MCFSICRQTPGYLTYLLTLPDHPPISFNPLCSVQPNCELYNQLSPWNKVPIEKLAVA